MGSNIYPDRLMECCEDIIKGKRLYVKHKIFSLLIFFLLNLKCCLLLQQHHQDIPVLLYYHSYLL
ncbi:MAG: hypothetical protein ACOCRK_11710, partial [bacterium]